MSALTDEEKEVLRLSILLWEQWVKLDAKHPSDDNGVAQALLAVQALVAVRVARRADRDIWWQPEPGAKSAINPPFTAQQLAKVVEGRAGWSYNPYRATLQLHDCFFALVTPNGKDALSPEDTTTLLRALNGTA